MEKMIKIKSKSHPNTALTFMRIFLCADSSIKRSIWFESFSNSNSKESAC